MSGLEDITNLLLENEMICFQGSYLKGKESSNPNKNAICINCEIGINQNNYNLLTDKWFYHLEFRNPDVKNLWFLGETYGIFSFPVEIPNVDSTSIGTIYFSNTYPDVNTKDGTTSKKVVRFPVMCADGIYTNIKAVIIDFRNLERQMYFIQ